MRSTGRIRKDVFGRTAGHCHFCGDSIVFENYGRGQPEGLDGAWEIDHVIQRGKGGARTIDNCLPACIRCNRLRWHRTGSELRELILLGLVAHDEIKRGSKLGQTILSLKTERLRRNDVRRKQGNVPFRLRTEAEVP